MINKLRPVFGMVVPLVFLGILVITACSNDPGGSTPTTEDTVTLCEDGVDNDGDGHIDCNDADCLGLSPCAENTAASCNDGIDNDGDGFTDCNDTGCSEFCP